MQRIGNVPVRVALVCILVTTLSACGAEESQSISAVTETSMARWYEAEQIALGQQVFTENCAVCHGAQAQGLYEDWRQRLADGSFPPPPLDGSAHAWHHPIPALLQVINYGGEALGGKMPPFDEVLEDDEKLAAIAYFQSFWSDEIYGNWQQMGGSN